NLLREVRMVISFDPFTMLIVEAALCGTPVLCIPNDPDCTQAQLDHTASIPGVFWIPEQMPKATADLEHVQAWHDGQMRTWDKSFEAFLTETQKWGAYR
ncbi:MAG: hypothetical protein Q7T05_05110, partial [Dehalococcoidia bacterium]|nr:hypothetical protein [Dehalococcoidia bacterium]